MVPTVEIRNVSDYVGQEVLVQGWLYNLRESGKLLFPLFRDGTGLIQGVVVKSAVSPELFERVRKLTQESSLRVTGKVRADKRAPGGFELDVTGLEIEQLVPSENPYPITPQRARHGIPDGPSPSLAALDAATGHPGRPARDHQSGARLLRRARLHLGGHAHLHALRLRGHHHALRGELLRRQSLPHTVRPALQRGRGHGGGQDLLLWARPSARKNPRPAAT